MINTQVLWMPQAPHLRLVCEKSVSHHPSSKSQSSWILHLLPPPQSHSAPTLSTGALPGVCGEWGGWLGASGSNAMLEWNSRPEQGTLLFLIFLITAILIGMISFDLQFWFKFSKWLVLLSTFSCACQSPVSLLWKNFYSGHLPILNRASHLFRRLSFMRYVYVFNISPRWLYHLQTSAIQ